MSRQPMTVFYVVYAIAGLLLLWVVIRGLMQGHSLKRIGKDLISPVSMVIGSLILWYVFISTGDMLKDIFKF
jgi:hypothetical protein